MRNVTSTILLASALSVSSVAQAQEEVSDDWVGSAGVGLVVTTGNAATETGNASLDLTRLAGDWAHQANLAATYAGDDLGTTAQQIYAALQTRRSLSEKSYIFGITTFDRNRFNNFKYQATAAVGYGYQFILTDTMNLRGQIGPGYRLNEVALFYRDAANELILDERGLPIRTGESESENEVILYASENFDYQFSETSKFIQSFSVESGSENTTLRLGLGLETNVAGNIALRLGYGITHNTDVADGIEKTDTTASVSLAYNF